MDNDLIRFKTVVLSGNLTKAAEKLEMTQPAITQMIHRLEGRFKQKLLLRSKSGVALSRAGEEIFKYIVEEEIRFNKLLNSINLTDSQNGKKFKEKIRIGMIDSLAHIFITEMFTQIQEEFPFFEIDLEVNRTESLINGIEKGELDYAYAVERESVPTNVIKRRLTVEPLYLASHKELHSLVTGNNWREKINFIGYNKESNTFKMINKQLESVGFKPNYVYYSSSPQIIKILLEQGVGFSVLPKSSLGSDNSNLMVYKKWRFKRVIHFYKHCAQETPAIIKRISELFLQYLNK